MSYFNMEAPVSRDDERYEFTVSMGVVLVVCVIVGFSITVGRWAWQTIGF
jgi:hypothetical protein